MAYADDGQGIKLKESSALFHEDSESWFQNLPHIGNVRPYGLAVARAKCTASEGLHGWPRQFIKCSFPNWRD